MTFLVQPYCERHIFPLNSRNLLLSSYLKIMQIREYCANLVYQLYFFSICSSFQKCMFQKWLIVILLLRYLPQVKLSAFFHILYLF